MTLASAQPGPQHIAVDATNVYWTNIGSVDDTGSVMTVAKDGGTPMALATAQRGPFGIAVDGANVYWTDVSRVMKVPTRRRRAGRGGVGAAARDRHRGGRDEHLLDRHGRGHGS